MKDEYGNKVEGFYIVGFFDKGKPAKVLVQTQKPFKTDINGHSSGNCFGGYKHNSFAKNWEFIENRKIKEIDKDINLRIMLNEIWGDWCKEHKRKVSKAFIEKRR